MDLPGDISSGRRGRRLLNEPSYDTDIETSSAENTSFVDDAGSFLKVDADDLTFQLMNMANTVDGSGFSMYLRNPCF